MNILRSFILITSLRCIITPERKPSKTIVPGFETPPLQYRPKFRYRLPDASVPSQFVIEDVNHIASVGAGGLEFLPFYNHGLGPAVTDWSVYGFGTAASKDVFTAALNASATHELAFDVTLGPDQGAGVPSIVESPGLAKELVYGNMTIQSGETYRGSVPKPVIQFNQISGFMNPLEPWGSNELVAEVAGKVVDELPQTGSGSTYVLEESSLVELTNLTTQGHISWTAPVGGEPLKLYSVISET